MIVALDCCFFFIHPPIPKNQILSQVKRPSKTFCAQLSHNKSSQPSQLAITMTTTFDQLNEHVLSEILRNLCNTRDYLSCEKVNKAFKSALSHDKLWGYIALKHELKQNLHLTPPSYNVDTSSDLVEDKYDFGNLNSWRDVVCCQQVLEYIRKEQTGPEPEDEANGARPHEFVHRLDRARDWCPVAFQRDLVLNIYRNRIAGDGYQIGLGWRARSELILRQDSLYVLLNIVSNHIVEHLEDAHLVERTPPTPNSSKSTLTDWHLEASGRIRSKHENWAFFGRVLGIHALLSRFLSILMSFYESWHTGQVYCA